MLPILTVAVVAMAAVIWRGGWFPQSIHHYSHSHRINLLFNRYPYYDQYTNGISLLTLILYMIYDIPQIYHRYITDIPHISLLITSWYNPKTQVDYTLPSFVAQQGSLNGSTDRGSTCPRWNPSHHPFLGPNWRKNIRESSTDQTWHKLWTCFFSCMDIPKMDGIPKTNIISKWAELYTTCYNLIIFN